MSSFIKRGSTLRSDDLMDDDTDDKDDTKRKSRNLSEKKRRDQFNLLINELSSMVSSNTRKMDKSTVLKSTISFLKNHNEVAVRSRAHEIQEDWKPSFLSNEEFTHLILEALDGFIMVFSSSGRIFYASESITSLLGHLPSDLLNMTIYDLVYDDDQSELYNVLLNPTSNLDSLHFSDDKENQISFVCHLKRGCLDFREEVTYELVQFVGYFRSDIEPLEVDNFISSTSRFSSFSGEADSRLVFVGTGRLQTPLLIREMSVVDSTKSEFTSRHSLEWKFLFLDHRAPPIIGYLPFEVLGTSGYDYYHVDDLEKVVACHEALMQKGEGTSCHYRFLTKGQQWIWLQTRFYITYHQWNSKPEFIVCTHRVVSYMDVMKQLRRDPSEEVEHGPDSDAGLSESKQQVAPPSQSGVTSSPWSSKSSAGRSFRLAAAEVTRGSRSRHHHHHDPGSDSTSMSADSPGSRHSSARSRASAVQPAPPTFLEPTQQYVIPVQPVLAGFPGTTAVVTSLPSSDIVRQPLVMTSAQTQIQEQLQRKHEHLQQMIMHQQEELRRVSEQLFMARYGLLSVPYAAPPPELPVAVTTMATRPQVQTTSVMIEPHQVNLQAHTSEEVIPFQLSQQQAQLLFTSANSTQHNQ